jgi:hypothetical protein
VESTPTDVIDYVGERPDGTAVLICLIAKPWDDTDEQFTFLGAKLRNYAAFVMDSQHVELYPQLAGKPVQILVVGVTRATPVTIRWLAQFALNFSRINATLEYRVVPSGSIEGALSQL